MRKNLGISYLLAGALMMALSAPVQAGTWGGTEEDAAVPPGSFVSTMTYPGEVTTQTAVKHVRVSVASK